MDPRPVPSSRHESAATIRGSSQEVRSWLAVGVGTSLAIAVDMTRLQALITSATLLAVVGVAGYSDAAPKKPKKPKEPKPAPAQVEEAAVFDKNAAASVLSSIDLSKCKSTNAPRGEGHIMVKFVPAGSATEATVDRGPLVGTPVARCIAKEFKKAKVPAFQGEVVQVGKSFRFE